MNTEKFKIAFVTDDGTTISPHFGRARYYEVLTVENGAVTARERRDKAGHHTFAEHEHGHEHHGAGHGMDEHSRGKHNMMMATITDCRLVVARGMGFGAYQHITEAGKQAVITEQGTIDDAVRQVIDGTLVHHEERLH
jgi:predicted Fe-Mo cluster-binding NifX family protein